jgi:hypothetical protein
VRCVVGEAKLVVGGANGVGEWPATGDDDNARIVRSFDDRRECGVEKLRVTEESAADLHDDVPPVRSLVRCR